MRIARVAFLFVAGAGFAACGDSSVSPKIDSSVAGQSVHGGGISHDLAPSETYRFQMTIDPKRSTMWDLGAGNKLTFPRGSLCDPAKSSYGPGEWDKPCVAAADPLTLNVTVWSDAAGHPRVDFEPSVRFVPSVDPRDWVILSFADVAASLSPLYNINYCPTATSACYNEAIDDPSLETLRDPKNGKLTRRIKHFSGYNVAAGEESDDSGFSLSADDLRLNGLRAVRKAFSASEGDARRIMDRINATRLWSGYILASGIEDEN